MSAVPGQTWSSSVRVINNNRHSLTVYASVVNFAPQGETGQGKFIPIFEDFTEGTTLAEWFEITSEPIVIPPEDSMGVPFTVRVPADASPGGHFAAIMIGTRPPDPDESFQIKTSQVVTSLFFARVAGDVIEDGSIREFSVVDSFVDRPKVDFAVRFQNDGNVHLQPQGEILITNMWGKERGVIPINHQTHFGNVLPDSIRKFEFTWRGEQSLTDIGRYTAVLTLGYGQDGKKFVSSKAYFWVVPVKAVLAVVGSIFAFVFLLVLLVRMYVRRMLSLAGVSPREEYQRASARTYVREGDIQIGKNVSFKAPIKQGVDDLSRQLEQGPTLFAKLRGLGSFILSYKWFFGGALLVVFFSIVGWYFIADVTTERKDYEVTIDNAGHDLTISSEQVMYDQGVVEEAATPSTIQEERSQLFTLGIVNSSEVPGAGAQLQKQLESEGYIVDELRSDLENTKERTVIVYDVSLQDEALALSKVLNNALLSALPEGAASSTAVASVTIFLGNEYAKE